MGSRLLLGCIKGNLASLIDDSPTHPLRDSILRFFKWIMDEGRLVIAVPLKSNSSKLSIFPKFSGNLSSFEQLDKLRVFRDIKLQIAIGRLERFLQSLRCNSIRLVECISNNDRSFIAVSLKKSFDKRGIFSTISGNFFSFEQPLRLKNSRASKLILWGRLSRNLQPFKSNRISLLRSPRDACILYSLVQRWRISCLRFGAPLRSGISIKFWESLRSMSFNSFKIYYKTRNN